LELAAAPMIGHLGWGGTQRGRRWDRGVKVAGRRAPVFARSDGRYFGRRWGR